MDDGLIEINDKREFAGGIEVLSGLLLYTLGFFEGDKRTVGKVRHLNRSTGRVRIPGVIIAANGHETRVVDARKTPRVRGVGR